MQQQESCADAAQRCASCGVELDEKKAFVISRQYECVVASESGVFDEIQVEDSQVVEQFCSEACMDRHCHTVLQKEGVELPPDLDEESAHCAFCGAHVDMMAYHMTWVRDVGVEVEDAREDVRVIMSLDCSVLAVACDKCRPYE